MTNIILIDEDLNSFNIGVSRNRKTSIIIVNYNNGPFLSRCLRSLCDSNRDEYEIILVDNASVDGSADNAVEQFPEIKLIRSHGNRGYGAGNNLGASLAVGEYLAFLNPDTEVHPDWLFPLIKALEINSRAGLVTPKILMNDQTNRINTCGNDVHISGITLCRGMGKSNNEFDQLEEVGAVSGAAFIIRKELFNTLGGFDEDFFLYMEDTDLSLRARLLGYHCYYVPDSIVYHDYMLKFTPKKTFYQERNRYMMLLLKCLQSGTLLALIPILLLAEMVTWGFSLLRDRRNIPNKFHAYGWVLNHSNSIMDKRRKIQGLRRAKDRELLQMSQYKLDYEQTGYGIMPTIAHFIFDPLFWILHKLIMSFLRW